MADYGLKVYSETDQSLIIDNNWKTFWYVGKAYIASVEVVFSGVDRTVRLWRYFAPSFNYGGFCPLVFYHVPYGKRAMFARSRWNGSQWEIYFATINDNNPSLSIYCFALSTSIPYSSVNYGMRVWDANGGLVYDSGQTLRALNVKNVGWVYGSPNWYVQNLPGGMYKPAIMLKSYYWRLWASSGYNCILSGLYTYFAQNAVQLQEEIVSSAGVPGGGALDNPTYNRTLMADVYMSVPVIEGTQYD